MVSWKYGSDGPFYHPAFPLPLLILCSVLYYYHVIEGFTFLPACKPFVSAGTPSGSVAYHRWLAVPSPKDFRRFNFGPYGPSITPTWRCFTNFGSSCLEFHDLVLTSRVLLFLALRNVTSASALREMEAVCSPAVLVPIGLHDLIM